MTRLSDEELAAIFNEAWESLSSGAGTGERDAKAIRAIRAAIKREADETLTLSESELDDPCCPPELRAMAEKAKKGSAK